MQMSCTLPLLSALATVIFFTVHYQAIHTTTQESMLRAIYNAFSTPSNNSRLLLHRGFRSLRSRYIDSLRAEQSADRIPVGTRLSEPVQPGPGAHPASYKMGTGSLSRG